MSYDAGVYGTTQTVFPGYEVDWQTGSAATTTTNSSGWEYILTSEPDQTIKYWDWSTKAYRFFAVTGYTEGEAPEPLVLGRTYKSAETASTYEFTMLADATDVDHTPYFSKLWFSTGVPEDYPDKQFGKPVQLEFMKPLARVRFLFNYSYAEEGIKLKEVEFKPTVDYTAGEEAKVKIARKGNFTVSYPLDGTAIREDFSVTDIDAVTRLEAFTEEYIPEGTEKWYVVLPSKTQGSFTLSVNLNGATKTCTVPEQYMKWLPGYSYTYIFKITELGGVEIELVQSAVTSWTEMEGDHETYNW